MARWNRWVSYYLAFRMKEHRRAVIIRDMNASAIAGGIN